MRQLPRARNARFPGRDAVRLPRDWFVPKKAGGEAAVLAADIIQRKDHVIAEPEGFGPAAVWLCAGFLLAGMGTVMLGPILPVLAQQWHMRDAESGALLFAKFTGAFVGGISVPRRLRWGILLGTLAGCVGFAAFALSTGPATAACALFVCGVGLGLMIASTNILAGRRYSRYTGTALSLINFFWSGGAVATGVLVAKLVPRYPLRDVVLSFAGLFLVVGAGGLLHRTGASVVEQQAGAEEADVPLGLRVFAVFALMLFLYGGLETCLTQWLTTYSQRYGMAGVLGGQSAMVLMWTALTAGRVLTSAALHQWAEATVQRVALVFCAALIPVLAMCRTAGALAVVCVLLGLSLAPFFPATFALLLRRRPPARQAGWVLAVSGLGAAGLSWLTGAVSTHVASLRVAMVVPFAAAVGLLAASWMVRGKGVAGKRAVAGVSSPEVHKAGV